MLALHALAIVCVIVHAEFNAAHADAVHVVETRIAGLTEINGPHDYFTAVFGDRVAGLGVRADVVIGGASRASELVVAHTVFD